MTLGSNDANLARMNSTRRPRLSLAWVRLVAVWAIVGLSIALADRAMPATAALSIEAERQAELYRKGY